MSIGFQHKYANQSQITLLYLFRRYKRFGMLILFAGVISLKKQGDTLTEGIEKSLIVTDYLVIFKKQGRFYCLNKSSF